MAIPTLLPDAMPVAAPRWGDAEEFMDRLKDTSDGAGDEAWE